eukprot:12911807-Ditylum_brightwellii.AAC.1
MMKFLIPPFAALPFKIVKLEDLSSNFLSIIPARKSLGRNCFRMSNFEWELLIKWRGTVSASLSADFNTSVSDGFRSTHPSFLNAF